MLWTGMFPCVLISLWGTTLFPVLYGSVIPLDTVVDNRFKRQKEGVKERRKIWFDTIHRIINKGIVHKKPVFIVKRANEIFVRWHKN